MLKAAPTLIIDCFSGRENPAVEIAREDFDAFYEKVLKLEKAAPALLFDGLGFRGFILSGPEEIVMYLQKNIIKIESKKDVQYRKNNRDVIMKLVSLFKKYEQGNGDKIPVEKIIAEYL